MFARPRVWHIERRNSGGGNARGHGSRHAATESVLPECARVATLRRPHWPDARNVRSAAQARQSSSSSQRTKPVLARQCRYAWHGPGDLGHRMSGTAASSGAPRKSLHFCRTGVRHRRAEYDTDGQPQKWHSHRAEAGHQVGIVWQRLHRRRARPPHLPGVCR